MNKKTYGFLACASALLTIFFQWEGDPFGINFTRIVIPSLVLLFGLQWFLAPVHYLWKASGFCADLAVFLVLFYYHPDRAAMNTLDFATWLFLVIAIQTAALWFLAPDNSTRVIVLSTSLATSYLIFLWAYLHGRGIRYPLQASGQFLVLSPLFAMALSVSGAAFKWRLSTQVVFVCVIVQIGMGLFDVGEANNIRWMFVSSLLVAGAALGLICYWARDWDKRERLEPKS